MRRAARPVEASYRPPSGFPEGMSTAEGWRLAHVRAARLCDELRAKSEPVSDRFGCLHTDALLAIVRKGATSDCTIEVEAMRIVLRLAQEALVRFVDHPRMEPAKRRFLQESSE